MSDFIKEVEKRRTFAIISHPDAGKTTITEQMLLFGGVIRKAGTVKARKTGNFATSDWMEIEKKRGISVTSSVMQFEYKGKRINILDTPGHQDFSEDTYRTLMAVDSAVMVIDSAKGIEPQTKKLFKVVKQRGIPIFTFMNKLDRDGRPPLDLIAELEDLLGIEGVAMNWPIGSGQTLKGLYDIANNRVELYRKDGEDRFLPLNDDGTLPDSEALSQDPQFKDTLDEIELIKEAGNKFNREKIAMGDQTPVFFGSALTNFGIEPFLKHFLEMTTPPLPRSTGEKIIDPFSEDFSAFVFKIQANMNKAHHDRIAFLRVCSGKFDASKDVYHVQSGKKMKLSRPQQIMAQDRKVIDEAYAGDVIGVFDPGIFSIGDTICTPGKKFVYEGIPTFAPEHFCRLVALDSMKRKQFMKGVTQIAQEGAIQIFQDYNLEMSEIIVGVVGTLQFDVLKYRMENEYGCDVRLEPLPYGHIRWVKDTTIDLNNVKCPSDAKRVKDMKGNPLVLFTNQWSIKLLLERNEGIEFEEFSRN